jgi:Bardet-Biedl syndrome 9 protein
MTFITWGWGEDITVLVSKKTGRYRIQGGAYHAFGVLMGELVGRLQSHYQEIQHTTPIGEGGDEGLVLNFEEDLPLGEYFPLLEAHHTQRQVVSTLHSSLTSLSQQFRAVQKRLLVRYKDKNPTPLLSFDVLLKESHQAIQALSLQLDGEQKALSDLSSKLAAASHHLVLLLSLKHRLDRKNTEALRQVFHLGGGEDRVLGGAVMDVEGGSGWEERLDAGLVHVLRFVLTKTAKGEGDMSGVVVEVMKDVGRLKKHLLMLMERLGKGMRLVVGTKEGVGKAAMQSPGTPPASASGGRRGEERRRQSSVDLRQQTQALVEVEEEEER